MRNIIKKLLLALTVFAICLTLAPCAVFAESLPANETVYATAEKPFRREVSPDKPMWIVHIDSWFEADPERIIELIPEDIKPYVVFNISLSINWDEEEQRFIRVEYGYETAKSWLRACAENGVWAMIQPASGGPCHFPDYDPAEVDYDDTLFGEFFREYPNFIGFNYCEQFWGFDNYVKGIPVTAEERYRHFAGLLELCNKYGGYLVDSWCGNEWGQSINPLAMLKRIPEFEEAARKYGDNFILLEKYTQTSYLYDMESLVFGTYLSGYCGNFGIRYDDTGWTDETGKGTSGYLLSTGLTVHFERMILNGATVIDGPELTWVDDFYEEPAEVDKKGYSSRKWARTTQFDNVFIDMFRKFTDGAYRIPTREEAIARTKIILVNDVATGNDNDKYCTPTDLYDGLYKMDGDGNLKDNFSFYKKTGRYPTVPITAGFADEKYEQMFELVIKKSEFKDIWPTVEDKVAAFDGMFEEQYTGDIYAGRYENTWVTYNPYKRSQTAQGTINLKYNTAESVSLSYPRYSTGIIKEYADKLEIYLNNFDEEHLITLKDDVIVINGAKDKPTFEITNRGTDNMAPKTDEKWENGVYTLTVSHNGPVDITVNCSGNGTGKLTDYQVAEFSEPEPPQEYHGTLQHEAEFFDILDVEQLVKNGAGANVRDYHGQGYLVMGMEKGAKTRETVDIITPGIYKMEVRVRAREGSVDVYINGKKNTVALGNTDGAWAEIPLEVSMKKGVNTVEVRLNEDLESKLYIDCFTLDLIEQKSGGAPIWIIIAAVAIVAAAVVAAVVIMKKKKK